MDVDTEAVTICEEVLLPNVTNGASEGDGDISAGTAEYLDEEEENDPMGDLSDGHIDEDDISPTKNHDDNDDDLKDDSNEDDNLTEEQPTSTSRATTRKDNYVDENQCRVCTSKNDLINLFDVVENQTIAQMLMALCANVSIAPKDFMPQYICNTCFENLTIAIRLKMQCERTESELRKRLSRSKNKIRRPAGFVVIDALLESDPPSEEEANDDEFKVSDVENASADDDSEDSDFSGKKRRLARSFAAKRSRRKPANASMPIKQRKTVGKRQSTNADSSGDEDSQSQIAKKKRSPKSDEPTEYACDECDQVYARKLSLVLHKKSHTGQREPINCKICGKQFKMHGAYRTHLERHKDNDIGFSCNKCTKIFPSNSELKRHMYEQHSEAQKLLQCDICKRTFVTEVRLLRHRDGHCPGLEMPSKRTDFENFAAGKELFKSVAPLKSTYWSDSFSD